VLPDRGRPLDRSISHLSRRGKNTPLNAWLFCPVRLLTVTLAANETVAGRADEPASSNPRSPPYRPR
jgi:hypothetical protein